MVHLEKLLISTKSSDFTAADVISATPFLAVIRRLGLSVDFSTEQWTSLERELKGKTKVFWMFACSVGPEDGEFLASICSRVEGVIFDNVMFEDFDYFRKEFEERVGHEDVVCNNVTFRWDTATTNREGILKLCEKIGWRLRKDEDQTLLICTLDSNKNV
jgi:hypothetical protein